MLATLREMKLPANLRVEIPAANDRAYAAIARIVSSFAQHAIPDRQLSIPDSRSSIDNCRSPIGNCPMPIISHGGARELLLRADCAVVASGTATLEAALANCPTILVYKASPLFAFIARRVIRGIRFVGLANIIWDKTLSSKGAPPPVAEAPMPELLQENLTVENLRRELEPLLADSSARLRAKGRLSSAMELLKGSGDPIGRIASALLIR